MRTTITEAEVLGDADPESVDRFYSAWRHYIGKGLIRKPNRVFSDPQKVTALYRATEALLTIQTDAIGTDRHPLESSSRGAYTKVFWIRDPELIAFILDNAERSETVAGFIQTAGTARVAELQFLLDGGVTSISNGSL